MPPGKDSHAAPEAGTAGHPGAPVPTAHTRCAATGEPSHAAEEHRPTWAVPKEAVRTGATSVRAAVCSPSQSGCWSGPTARPGALLFGRFHSLMSYALFLQSAVHNEESLKGTLSLDEWASALCKECGLYGLYCL